MIIIKEKTRKVTYSNYDYLFDKYKSFKKLQPYISPKFEGKWVIILLTPKLDEVEEMLNGNNYGDYADIIIYLERDVVEKVLERYPKAVYEKMSNWDLYMDYLATIPIKVDNRAVREIYRRCQNSIEMIKEAMPRIIEKSDGVVTVKDVNKVLIDNRRIYASQVVKEFMTLQRYRWEHLNILRKDIGDKVAFYAMRKYLRKLLVEKNKYLNNETTKERDIDKIDAYTISHALVQFELASNYGCLVSCLLSIERRQTC